MFDWVNAAALATMIGQIFGTIVRAMPFLANRITPLLVWAMNFIMNIVFVVNKFFEAAGVDDTVAALMPQENGIALAGLGWLGPILKAAIAAALAAAQLLIQRLIYEKAVKPAVLREPGEV